MLGKKWGLRCSYVGLDEMGNKYWKDQKENADSREGHRIGNADAALRLI